MLLLAVFATIAMTGVLAEQGAAAGPGSSYGPPQTAPGLQQYSAPVPVQPYPAAAPEASALPLPDGATYLQYPDGSYTYSDPGFSVQSGYEGYLVPEQAQDKSVLAAPWLLGSLLPFSKLGIALFPKVGLFLLGFLFLLLIGGAFTTAVCAFTPICTISFLGLGLTRNTMRTYITPDRLTQTTAFVLDAIDKYKDFAKKVSAKEARSKKDRRRR